MTQWLHALGTLRVRLPPAAAPCPAAEGRHLQLIR